MPITPGLLVMPTVIANTAFSFVKDRSLAIRSPDSLAVISPMYNEEKGAPWALKSLLEQTSLPNHIAISINGGTDATYKVVVKMLMRFSYACQETKELEDLNAVLQTWTRSDKHKISILIYRQKTAKSQSINTLVERGIVSEDRILVVDGDTVFHKDFIRILRDNFYRLTIRKRGGKSQFIIEDFGLQSGSVTSLRPRGRSLAHKLIAMARTAEYAFSGILRTGQTKLMGRSAIFGNSRLFTVIGCGFAVRRDLFPMPVDTETEDHDFTLACQNHPLTVSQVGPKYLDKRGFKFVQDGKELSAKEMFDTEDEIVLRQGGNARFVGKALMATEDPPHFNGLVRQVERWNGGSQQSALKRVNKVLTAGVHYTVWTALAENLLGLLLLSFVPIALALHYGNPSLGWPLPALRAWLGLDFIFTLLLVCLGLYRQHRALGFKKPGAGLRAIWGSLYMTIPFMIVRYINPLTYLASATRVVPSFIRMSRKKAATKGVTWERAFERKRTRTQVVFLWTLLGTTISMVSVASFASYLNPINQEAWQLIHANDYVNLQDFDHVPVIIEPLAVYAPRSASLEERPYHQLESPSAYCSVEGVKSASDNVHRLYGDADAYEPLSRWGLVTLARLVPLVAYLENAATAYDVPVDFYLQILLNESYLDPLAVGATDDKGLSQMTSDALTMLKALSIDPQSAYYNPELFASGFSVFDPDFSICAGAAKLAWAMGQPDVDDTREAYALYINPVYGFVDNKISDIHLPLTDAMVNLEPMIISLANLFAAYQENPGQLSVPERKLMNVATLVRLDYLSIEDAYRMSYDIVRDNNLRDREMYQALFVRFFGDVAVLRN